MSRRCSNGWPRYPEKLAGYGLENWVRVLNVSADCEFNWKIIRDNFNESYHLPTIHPELSTFINDGLPTTVFEMYPKAATIRCG
jgi:phenylpropionate dioxygenase-like ring-hydroxylating dioxygenase large terminal subunit